MFVIVSATLLRLIRPKPCGGFVPISPPTSTKYDHEHGIRVFFDRLLPMGDKNLKSEHKGHSSEHGQDHLPIEPPVGLG